MSTKTKFLFDDSKRFAENCESFLDVLQAEDPQMTKILRDNWDALLAIVREGYRDQDARREFNAKVASALDALVTVGPSKVDE